MPGPAAGAAAAGIGTFFKYVGYGLGGLSFIRGLSGRSKPVGDHGFNEFIEKQEARAEEQNQRALRNTRTLHALDYVRNLNENRSWRTDAAKKDWASAGVSDAERLIPHEDGKLLTAREHRKQAQDVLTLFEDQNKRARTKREEFRSRGSYGKQEAIDLEEIRSKLEYAPIKSAAERTAENVQNHYNRWRWRESDSKL